MALAACADSPEPAAPVGQVQAAVGASQDRLPGWFAQASPEVLALPGTVFADHDEANGRLRFGAPIDAPVADAFEEDGDQPVEPVGTPLARADIVRRVVRPGPAAAPLSVSPTQPRR